MNVGLSERFDLLRAAIGLFVGLGVVLTALGVYVVLAFANISVPTNLVVSVLSGVSLVAFAALLTTWLHGQTSRRRPGRSV